ncbi:MAG: hypothetical protein ACI4MK_12580 [Aristaeellaceae bacterium]
MSVKIKISYEREEEAEAVLSLLRPLEGLFKVKKSEGRPPYKHIFFTPKNGGKARRERDSA